MDPIRYFIVSEKEGVNLTDIFKELINRLSNLRGVKVEGNSDKVTISYDKDNFTAILLLNSSKNGDIRSLPQIELVCQDIDGITINLVRAVSEGLNIRIFNALNGLFLPRDPYLVEMSTGLFKPEIVEIITKKGFIPLYYIKDSLFIYAKPINSSAVHIINPYLIEYYVNFGTDTDVIKEFSYEVAPNIQQFVARYDKGLIPIYFYDYYQKSLKIINHSGLDIRDPGRKIFIKPLIYELDSQKQDFLMFSGEKGSTLFMDKIRPGETLDISLKRILNDLHAANDYIAALVARDIEFDRDKDGVLTPRLIVFLYVEKIDDKANLEKFTKRTWTSLA